MARAAILGVLTCVWGCGGGSGTPDDDPRITSAAPASATEATPYAYAATVDGVGAVPQWRMLPTHTCGGDIDATTGAVAFTIAGPTPPATCTLSIEACADRCATQIATIAVIAVNDPPAITTTAPAIATEDLPYAYAPGRTDPDGPQQRWALTPAHTCGGRIDSASGAVEFTVAGPTPPATCTLAVQGCDEGEPSACATELATIAVSAVNDAPMITSTGWPTAVEDTAYDYPAVVDDPDGPTVQWSLVPGHTCGGGVDASGRVMFTIAGPVPPPICTVAIQACDGGAADGCVQQQFDVTVTAVDDPPTAVDDQLLVLQESTPRTLDVLLNDVDSDSGPRTVAAVTAATHGTATIVPGGGGVRYAPAPGYCNSQPGGGVDSFTYQLAPGGATATVTVRVACAGSPIGLSNGDEFTCAVFDSGFVRCWGRNDRGQLGLGDIIDRGDAPGEMGVNLPPVDLGVGARAVAVAAGQQHACALLADGDVKCWGTNGFGRLGLGDTASRGDGPGEMGDALPRVALGTGRTAVGIMAGDSYSCAILDTGDVKCWGDNFFAQLGLGDTANRGDGPGEMGDNLPTVALPTGRNALALGGDYGGPCAVLDDGSLRCWGAGFGGNRGDVPGEMGDALPGVPLGTGRSVMSFATDGELFNFACARLDDATVKCFGKNDRGQLGLGDRVDRYATATLGDNLPPVALGAGRTVVMVDVGDSHACARLTDGAVKCWGSGGDGRLGLGDTTGRGGSPGQMGDNLPVVPLGVGRTATALAIGFGHTCALLDDATIKCWGLNQRGQLGLGDTESRGDAISEMGAALPAVDL